MDAINLKKLQIAQLEIMDEIHRICEKNDIKYYMIGGTALGAVRHKGFIPWDIDIDIAMDRKNYDRFKEVCNTDLNPRFIYRDYINTERIKHGHALVCIKNSLLVTRIDKYNPNEEKLEIYLDIFPLDNAPADEKLQKSQAKKILRLKNQRFKKLALCYDNNLIKNYIKKIISKMLFWTSAYKINAKLDQVMRKYNNSKSGYICSMASHFSYKKQCMPIEVYGTPKLMDFEDKKYYAPEQVEDYLTRIYGDYMKLPPESERQNNLDVFTEIHYDGI